MKHQLETRLRDSPFLLINTSMDSDRPLPQEKRFSGSDTTPLASSSSKNSRRSKSIPLPSSHVYRTHSEVQLCEDMESAERRDLNMFYRLVNGIRERQVNFTQETLAPSAVHPLHPERHQDHAHDTATAALHKQYMASKETETCLAHIIHTRNTPLDKASYLQQHRNSSKEQSSSLPFNSSHQAMEATLALHAMNQGASSDPEQHQDEEEHFQQVGWSLTGFDEEQNKATAPLQDSDDACQAVPEDDVDDEGIFDLDL